MCRTKMRDFKQPVHGDPKGFANSFAGTLTFENFFHALFTRINSHKVQAI